MIGIAGNDAQNGDDVIVIIGGKAKGLESLQTGRRYYLGKNGLLTTALPANALKVVPIGVAFSDSEMIIQLAPDTFSEEQTIATVSAALNTPTPAIYKVASKKIR